MGKRSDFERDPKDFYETPSKAVDILVPHLTGIKRYIEPFYGRGKLTSALERHGLELVHGFELQTEEELNIMPGTHENVEFGVDVLSKNGSSPGWWWRAHFAPDAVIMNSPWRRDILHPAIEKFMHVAPTWALFDADWAHTVQAKELLPHCSHIVATGRHKWIPDSKYTGKDNSCWHRFDVQHTEGPRFYGRA